MQNAETQNTETQGTHVPSYVPPGWPRQVRPPGVEGWEATASTFLFDSCPADFRAYTVLRRHPIVLARFAARFVDSQLDAAADGVAEMRSFLRGVAEPGVTEAAIAAWEAEHAALVRRRREIRLVEEALAGHVFIPKL